MAIQLISDGHALAAAGIPVVLYVVPSRVHRARSVEDVLAFYGLPPQPGLRLVRLPFARKTLRKKLGAPVFWAAVIAELVARRRAPRVVLSRSRRITRGLLALRRLTRLRYAVVQEIHEDGTAGLPAEEADARAVARERALFQQLDGIIATSPAVGRYLQEGYGLGRRVRIIPNGANTERFLAIEPPPAAPAAAHVLGYAGNFNAWKDVTLVLECLTHLPPHVRLLLLGGKLKYARENRRRLDDLMGRFGVADRVEYRGFVPPSALPGELARADILVLPLGDNPIGRFFTSPLKLFEYMAAGRPIIAPAFPTVTPFLTDRVSGLLLDPMTPPAVAAAAAELIADPALAARLAANARRDAPRYSRARRAEQVADLVRAVGAE